MECIKFENLDPSRLAYEIVLKPIKAATDGAFIWQSLQTCLSLTIAKHDAKTIQATDTFSVKLVLPLPDGRCFCCEKRAETLACAAKRLSVALRQFLKS